jgi:serine/threonine protein kinase
MAPELINKNFYNELVDVWSVGVILIELIEGEPPYLRLPALKAMYFISTKDAYRLNKQKYGDKMCDFVERCLEKDLKKRWSIKRLLEHPFIKQIGDGQKERAIFADMVKNKKNVPLSQLMAEH